MNFIPNNPKIALVVPCYGYSNFICEQLQCILTQRSSTSFVVVVADDCDPDTNLIQYCNIYAEAYPELIHYIRVRHNAGLPAIRNTGIEYVLRFWSSVEVIMFPDADDRMTPDFIDNSYAAFKLARKHTDENDEKLGWVFEHPDIFGIGGRMLRLIQHSTLWNMAGATQMPSSALSIELFKEGLRYEEYMLNSGEDWLLSIAALEAGFVGRYAGYQGFSWRRRPGSLSVITNSNKLILERNLTEIRLAHEAMFSKSHVMNRYRIENSHYAVIRPEGVSLGKSATEIANMTQKKSLTKQHIELAALIHKNRDMPAEPCPQSYYFTSREIPRSLAKSGLMAFFCLVSEFYIGEEIQVNHIFNPAVDNDSRPTLKKITRDSSDLSDIIVHSKSTLQNLINDKYLKLNKKQSTIEFEWSIPCNDLFFQTDENSTTNEIFIEWIDRYQSILAVPEPEQGRNRYQIEKWKPRNLNWRQLTAFHMNVPRVFICPENIELQGLHCQARDFEQALSWIIAQKGEPPVLFMSGHVDHELEFRLNIAYENSIINDFFMLDRLIETSPMLDRLMETGPSKSFWRDDIFDMLMIGYDRITFWSSMVHSTLLSALRGNNVKLEIVFPDSAAAVEILGTKSSIFKAFDKYQILSQNGDEKSTLNSFGIPDETIVIGDYIKSNAQNLNNFG